MFGFVQYDVELLENFKATDLVDGIKKTALKLGWLCRDSISAEQPTKVNIYLKTQRRFGDSANVASNLDGEYSKLTLDASFEFSYRDLERFRLILNEVLQEYKR